MNRVPGVVVTPYAPTPERTGSPDAHHQPRYHGKIQDKGEDYYMQFNLVICGLDSVEARRWINATLVNMVDPEVPESLKPLIDGGTEGRFVCSGDVSFWCKSYFRLQRPSPCHPPNCIVVLRMFSRYVEQADGVPDLYHRKHASITGTLYRMGICSGMASCLPRFVFAF